ncbi:Uncharacterised protein [uncultured archaeon]|nr:Uncharacterised protein [uncultured archaeon]
MSLTVLINEAIENGKDVDGKYIVIGVDKFSGDDFIEGTYEDSEEALKIAIGKTQEAVKCASDSSITIYYVYEFKARNLRYLGGDICNEEFL